MKTVTSKDDTTIAFDQSGAGPVVILVDSALADRSAGVKLAKLLARKFTVINYDRRGRGDSGDTPPYAVEREVEDIEALIDQAGGSAFVFGSSSGAALALESANKLSSKIKKQALYEPPFIVDDSRPPMRDDMAQLITELVAKDRRSDAVKLFFSEGMGIPAFFVTLMRFMPGWAKSTAMAHTLPYDFMILKGTQTGKPLPSDRWTSVAAPTLVLTGGKSEAFFHKGAQALVKVLPNAQHRILKDQHHGSAVMSPQVIASEITEFFGS
jgi:pimeloyl-ACP methyl ester carboxylesterase